MSEQNYLRPAQHEHNNLLDELHDSILNTQHYAISIGSHLQDQEQMIDTLHGGVTQTAEETQRRNRDVSRLLVQSQNRGFYVAVIVLVVIILFLLMI